MRALSLLLCARRVGGKAQGYATPATRHSNSDTTESPHLPARSNRHFATRAATPYACRHSSTGASVSRARAPSRLACRAGQKARTISSVKAQAWQSGGRLSPMKRREISRSGCHAETGARNNALVQSLARIKTATPAKSARTPEAGSKKLAARTAVPKGPIHPSPAARIHRSAERRAPPPHVF